VTIRSPAREKIATVLSAPWINRIEVRGDDVVVSLRNAEQHISTIVTRLNEAAIPIDAISVHKPTLEDVFLSYTGKTIRDEEAGGKDAMRMHFRMMRH
jgi:ABC-2 type transport system ATP-binding protein